jgi:hypothetical protein
LRSTRSALCIRLQLRLPPQLIGGRACLLTHSLQLAFQIGQDASRITLVFEPTKKENKVKHER